MLYIKSINKKWNTQYINNDCLYNSVIIIIKIIVSAPNLKAIRNLDFSLFIIFLFLFKVDKINNRHCFI